MARRVDEYATVTKAGAIDYIPRKATHSKLGGGDTLDQLGQALEGVQRTKDGLSMDLAFAIGTQLQGVAFVGLVAKILRLVNNRHQHI